MLKSSTQYTQKGAEEIEATAIFTTQSSLVDCGQERAKDERLHKFGPIPGSTPPEDTKGLYVGFKMANIKHQSFLDL